MHWVISEIMYGITEVQIIKYATHRVQKKSRLHGSEPEENFTLYDVFEEGFEICINNPVSAKFLYNATSSVKGIAYLQ